MVNLIFPILLTLICLLLTSIGVYGYVSGKIISKKVSLVLLFLGVYLFLIGILLLLLISIYRKKTLNEKIDVPETFQRLTPLQISNPKSNYFSKGSRRENIESESRSGGWLDIAIKQSTYYREKADEERLNSNIESSKAYDNLANEIDDSIRIYKAQ